LKKNRKQKTIMNKFPKAAAIVATAGVLLFARGAQAAYLANDLVLGFNGTLPSQADYVINLGNFQTSVGVGGGAVVDLSSSFNLTTFNGLYGTLSRGVSMSVVGGKGATSGRDIFATVTRSGLGTPSFAGSTAPDALLSTPMANGANRVGALAGPTGLGLSAGQSTTVAQSDPNSFNTWILSSTPPSYLSDTGIDPRGTSAGSTLYEDLYRAQNGINGNAFEYLGFFTLDTASSPNLTFTPTGVPEPGPVTLAVLGSFLLFVLRWRFKSRVA
jgi:hypothetical protein